MPEESFTTLLPHLLLLNQMGREKFVGKLRAMTTIGVPWAEIIRACKVEFL
jgi:hypothetical protein